MASSNQLSNLPRLTKLVTGHNEDAKAIVHSSDPFSWQKYDDDKMAFSVIYTTSTFPPNLTANADITAHEQTLSTGLGLVNPNGTVLRCVDFAPGYVCLMHRTKSLDYGIVLEGEIDMVLDSGEVRRMGRGDVAVQRATMHQWRNRSKTEWAQMMFVLQDCVAEDTAEDLGEGLNGLPPSGN